MKRQLLTTGKSLILSSVLLLPLGATAAIVYDNTATYLNQYYGSTNGFEFGDQITLGGTDRTLTRFEFEAFAPVAGVTYTLSLYLNDGPLVGTSASPGTKLTDFTAQPMAQGFLTYVTDFTLALPAGTDGLTWTVQFSSPDAGLLLYDPPSPGSSLNDFWENSGGAWGLATIPGTVANFNARISAVPEPGTIALGALGVLLAVGCKLRRRAQ